MIIPELLELLKNMTEKNQRALYKELLQMPIKRKYIRRTYGKEIGYAVSGKEYIDVMKDLSFEGAFIETTSKFKTGQIIQIEIPMANSAKILRTTGVIVRTTNEGVGLKLTKDKKFEHEDDS